MAGPKLDGAGTVKMAALDDAAQQLQRIHGLVEQWALAVKRDQPTSLYSMQLRRQLPTLASLLKSQFGMISDQVTAMHITATRGGAEGMKIRGLREGVAQVRTALEIAVAQTKDKHTQKEETPATPVRD